MPRVRRRDMRRLALILLFASLAPGCGSKVDPAAAVSQARELLAGGQTGAARVLLKNALKKDSSHAQARVLLAGIALGEGNPQGARNEISAADESALDFAEAVVLRVRIALALDDAGEAARIFTALGSVVPEPDRTVLEANVLVANDESAQALALLRALQQESPPNQRLAIEISNTLAAMGDLDSAIAELDRYLASGRRERSDALLARGTLHLWRGAPDQAKEDFVSAREAAPAGWSQINRITTEMMIADAMLADGDALAARSQISAIGKRWPGMLGTELLGAHLALLEGRPGEAADRLLPLAEADPGNERLQYLLIEAMTKSGNFTRATELLERRITLEPDSSPARQALAELYMQQGRPDRVIALLGDGETVSILGPESGDDLLATARRAREEASVAAVGLRRELQERPDDAELRARLAAAQIAQGDPSSALVTLGPMPLDGWRPEGAAARMSALLAMGNEFEANRLVDRLLDPPSGAGVDVLLAAADVAYQARQIANASRLLDRAAALESGNVEVQVRRASLAFDARDFAKATKILEPMLDRGAAQQRVRVALSRVAEAQGDVDKARALLEAAARSDPAEEEPALALAGLELRANRPTAAGRALDRFVAAAPDGSAASLAGLLLADEGRFEEARMRFRQAVDSDPENAQYWFNLGQSHITLADHAAAADSFSRAAQLEPSSVLFAVAAVQLGLEQNDMKAARRAADAAVAVLPGNATAALLQGEVAFREGRDADAAGAYARSYSINPAFEAAVGEFRARQRLRAARPDEPLKRWIAREPDDMHARRVLSDHYIVEGLDREAQEQLEQMLKRMPNDFIALNNLAWLLRNTDGARAEQLAVQASAIAPDNPDVTDTLETIRKANETTSAALRKEEYR